MIAQYKVKPSGDYEESYGLEDYQGDYDIVVAKAWRTDEPVLKTKPSGFSWDDTWYSDADFQYVSVSSEAPTGYYLAD